MTADRPAGPAAPANLSTHLREETMPRYPLDEHPEDEMSPDERWAALKTTIGYLQEEATRFGFQRVATALRRALAVLEKARLAAPKTSGN